MNMFVFYIYTFLLFFFASFRALLLLFSVVHSMSLTVLSFNIISSLSCFPVQASFIFFPHLSWLLPTHVLFPFWLTISSLNSFIPCYDLLCHITITSLHSHLLIATRIAKCNSSCFLLWFFHSCLKQR